MKTGIQIVLIILISFSVCIGQNTEELEENFSEGQYFFIRGDYEDAVIYYLKLVQADSNNANFNFKVGECYLNIPGKEALAIPFFEASRRKLVSKKRYKKRSVTEDSAPLHALFYLGNAYRINNELNKALECYAEFIDSPFYYGNYNQNIVDQEVKSCERAKIIQDAPLSLEIQNPGDAINTEFVEEKPVVSGDGNTLVFVRRLKFYDAVFCSRKINGEWQKAVNINPEILSDGEFFPTGLSKDGNKLLLIKDVNGNADIYFSIYNGESWSKALPLPGKINSPAKEIHASFGKNENTIFLSGNGSGSQGGYDIFISQMKSDGEWGKPKNAGKEINTEFDEINPYYCHDGKILFFSSAGHYNMGGLDIFYSRKNEKLWSLPTNIGYGINDTRDNRHYCPDAFNRRLGYVTVVESDNQTNIYILTIKSENVLTFDDDKNIN